MCRPTCRCHLHVVTRSEKEENVRTMSRPRRAIAQQMLGAVWGCACYERLPCWKACKGTLLIQIHHLTAPLSAPFISFRHTALPFRYCTPARDERGEGGRSVRGVDHQDETGVARQVANEPPKEPCHLPLLGAVTLHAHRTSTAVAKRDVLPLLLSLLLLNELALLVERHLHLSRLRACV